MALGLSTSTFLFDSRDRYHGVVLTMEVPQIQLSTSRWTFLFGNRDTYLGVSGSRQQSCLSFCSSTVWKSFLFGNRDAYRGVSHQWGCLRFSSLTLWRTLLSGNRDRSQRVQFMFPRGMFSHSRSKQCSQVTLSQVRHISPFPTASTDPLPSNCHEVCTGNP